MAPKVLTVMTTSRMPRGDWRRPTPVHSKGKYVPLFTVTARVANATSTRHMASTTSGLVDHAQASVRSLAAGREHEAQHHAAGLGWVVRTRRAPIIKNSELVVSEYSQGAWRRELSLTLLAGQHLPSLLGGGSSLELQHEASGVRIGFCALEALRSWALLDLPPVPHLAPHAPPAEWDYTFTTSYAGSTTVAPLGTRMPAQPDVTSFYARPAVDLVSGKPRLRKPLCKCKGMHICIHAYSLAPWICIPLHGMHL
jgi:hypothetical protein